MLTSQNAIIRSFGHAVMQCAYIIPPSIAKVTYECKLPVEVTCPELSRVIKMSVFATAATVTYRQCQKFVQFGLNLPRDSPHTLQNAQNAHTAYSIRL
jgi:hypothetical protein